MPSLIALCACLSLGSTIAPVFAQGTYSYTPPAAVPTGASLAVAASYAGFGIEPSNLFSFTGGSEPNDLSINLLQNLANYTGTPPHLRIGGNTEDYFKYEANITEYAIETNPDPTVSSAAYAPDMYLIGPTFFKALDRFPTNTPITFGLNMAYEGSDYAERLIAEANASVTLLTNVNLVSFEIGNEPDLYLENGFRTGTWDGSKYTTEWLDRAAIVYTNVLKPNGYAANFFEPACTASTLSTVGESFTISDLQEDGILVTANGTNTSYVAVWNQHDYYYYIGVSTYVLTIQEYTDLSTTATQFAAWTDQVVEATDTGYRYALREMGDVGPVGESGITDVFAAALWTLNFFLYAATLNITSVEMDMTDNGYAAAWLPVESDGQAPYVRPSYYAYAAMAQLIGCGGGIQIAGPGVISDGVSSDYENRLAIYTSYRSSELTSIVILNTVIANASDTSKESMTVDLSLPDFANKDLYLSYLTADGSDSTTNTTFNGISYEQNDVGTPVTINSTVETVTVGSDGSATVSVRDSQALIVNIGSALGSNGTCSSAVNKKHTSTTTTTATTSASATATSMATSSTGANSKTSQNSSSSNKQSGASSLSLYQSARDSKIHHHLLSTLLFYFSIPLLTIILSTLVF